MGRCPVCARVGLLEAALGAAGDELVRISAMTQLGNGLTAAARHEDALSVREAELAILRRLAHQKKRRYRALQGNLASTYRMLGRVEEALSMRQEIYA